LAEEEAGLGEAVDVGHGAGRVVEAGADVGVDAAGGVESEGAAVAAAAARCVARCDSGHSGRPRPRAWDRWLDRAGRVERTATAPAAQGPTIVAGLEADTGCSVAGCQAQGSWTSGRPCERLARVAGGRTMAVSIHLSVSTDYVRVKTTRPIVQLECAGKKSYIYVESAHSTTGRRRDGSDSVDCYASERSSRLDLEYVERVDGETAQDVSEMQLRRDAMTTHPALPTISSSRPQSSHNSEPIHFRCSLSPS
jgi:hypothetical protein